MRSALRRAQSSAGPQPAAAALMGMEGSQGTAVGTGRNFPSGAVPGALRQDTAPLGSGEDGSAESSPQ